LPEVEQEFWIWRPIIAGKVTLRDVKDGTASVRDIQILNALLDMQADIQDKYQESVQ
jgi:hypothetical protein